MNEKEQINKINRLRDLLKRYLVAVENGAIIEMPRDYLIASKWLYHESGKRTQLDHVTIAKLIRGQNYGEMEIDFPFITPEIHTDFKMRTWNTKESKLNQPVKLCVAEPAYRRSVLITPPAPDKDQSALLGNITNGLTQILVEILMLDPSKDRINPSAIVRLDGCPSPCGGRGVKEIFRRARFNGRMPQEINLDTDPKSVDF